MEGIHLPMSQGTMDDITQEGEPSSQMDQSTGESMNTQGARAIYEREAHIVIDYSRLSEDNKDVCHHSLTLNIKPNHLEHDLATNELKSQFRRAIESIETLT